MRAEMRGAAKQKFSLSEGKSLARLINKKMVPDKGIYPDFIGLKM